MSNLAIRERAMDEARIALADICEKYGHITPELVVEAARDKNNPLHGYFKWNNKEAGEMFRLNQARFLIRTVKLDIVRLDKQRREVSFETTRAYVSPPSLRGGDSYVTLGVAMDDEAIRADLVARAKRELQAVRNRYKQLAELSAVWEAVELL